MPFSKTRKRVLIITVLVILILCYHYILLPGLLSWGATHSEFMQPLPGDELIKEKGYKNTLAITINASPSRIWPWVAQMGLHKGGFYSYTRLENLFGCKLKNANTIHAKWQNPKPGDIEPVCQSQEGKPGAGWQIAIVDKNKALVWKGLNQADWMMGIYIDSMAANQSRIITRQQFKYPKKWSVSWWLEKCWFEWAHCVMQRGMIKGIKKRAEG